MRNKKRIQSSLCVLGAFILFFSTAGNAFAGSLYNAQQQKDEMENRLEETKQLIEELELSQQGTQINIRQLDNKLTEISENIISLEMQRLEKEKQIEAATKEVELLKEKADEQYESMKVRIRFMYENSKQSTLELFFSSGSLADLINRAEYIARITEYDRNMLNEYRETAAMVAQMGTALEVDLEEVIALKEQVKEEEKAAELLLEAKERQLAQIGNDLTEAERLAQIYEAEIQAQDEIIALIQAQGGIGDVVYNGEVFLWPCPSSTRITSDYGMRESPTAGATTYHEGIDIGAAYGEDIIAVAAGTVSYAGYSNTAGNFVMINHGNGLQSVYFHASALTVTTGQAVAAGQVIAKIGSTGISTGNHLHFGVSINGNYVSPWIYLQ